MILKGDCIEVMKAMKPNSVDAIVTDAPYGLAFMNKEWDKLWDKRKPEDNPNLNINSDNPNLKGRKINPVSRKLNNPNYKAGIEAQLWHAQWLTQAYRVLKPGGSMLVMGGTRTSHRLACAIEDSGFIIKDTIFWLFGSGFPKCQDITPMIDGKILGITTKQVKERREVIGKRITGKAGTRAEKRNANLGFESGQMTINETKPLTQEAKYWDGFKVGGIKPAYEPIIWAVKPPEGSYVDNVLKWGVGAVNVDECRISHDEFIRIKKKQYDSSLKNPKCMQAGRYKDTTELKSSGRFPANVILSHHPECVQVGMKRVKNQGGVPDRDTVKNSKPAFTSKEHTSTIHHFEKDGLEIVESWDCHPDCAVRLLDEQSGVRQSKWGKDAPDKISGSINYVGENRRSQQQFRGDSGGASRFFKQCNYGQEEGKIQKPLGRFPANIILSHHHECVQMGMKKVRGGTHGKAQGGFNPTGKTIYGKGNPNIDVSGGYNLETVESWDCHPDCAVRLLDEQSGILGNAYRPNRNRNKSVTPGIFGADKLGETYPDNGGASRFFYCAKASRRERNAGLEELPDKLHGQSGEATQALKEGKSEYLQKDHIGLNKIKVVKNNHPTVKPIKLFEWLIKLVTREGQIVLDPFIGSGTTGIAAHNTKRKCVGIEKEGEYLEIAKRRTAYWQSRPRQLNII